MKSIVTYLAPIVAFSATFIGLLGPSRAPDKTGLRAITPFGWAACALAAISLCVAVYLLRSREVELEAGRVAQQRMRAVVSGEIWDGLKLLRDVLRYAALMPYTTTPVTGTGAPEEIPYVKYRESRRASDIDLHSKEVIGVLDRLYLSPASKLTSPFIPSAVPFGTSVARPSFAVIVDESTAAAKMIETAVQKYAAVALTPETIEAASELIRSPFLKHLMNLRESWKNRSEMEDSASARTLNFRFLNSGLTGGNTAQYVELISRIDRLSAKLEAQK
ncbi:MAG: hypothetical protein NTW28_37865 [Candidatus Solibacter sp.]|nr:hypothetical protein [Candidatus Solibacter sp.]